YRFTMGSHVQLEKLEVFGLRAEARSIAQVGKDVDVGVDDGSHGSEWSRRCQIVPPRPRPKTRRSPRAISSATIGASGSPSLRRSNVPPASRETKTPALVAA